MAQYLGAFVLAFRWFQGISLPNAMKPRMSRGIGLSKSDIFIRLGKVEVPEKSIFVKNHI